MPEVSQRLAQVESFILLLCGLTFYTTVGSIVVSKLKPFGKHVRHCTPLGPQSLDFWDSCAAPYSQMFLLMNC